MLEKEKRLLGKGFLESEMLEKGEKSPRYKVLLIEQRDQALPRKSSRVESLGHPRVCSLGFLELYVPIRVQQL